MVIEIDELDALIIELKKITEGDYIDTDEIIKQVTKIVVVEASLLLGIIEETDDLKQRIK